jgi:hypothetical protein
MRFSGRQQEMLEITVSDGSRFQCAPKQFGEPHDPIAHRWSIRSTTAEHVGPPVMPDRSLAAIQRLVDEWWEQKKRLGCAE